jgi:hypothetical protein
MIIAGTKKISPPGDRALEHPARSLAKHAEFANRERHARILATEEPPGMSLHEGGGVVKARSERVE